METQTSCAKAFQSKYRPERIIERKVEVEKGYQNTTTE
jgi:hypothetical protein